MRSRETSTSCFSYTRRLEPFRESRSLYKRPDANRNETSSCASLRESSRATPRAVARADYRTLERCAQLARTARMRVGVHRGVLLERASTTFTNSKSGNVGGRPRRLGVRDGTCVRQPRPILPHRVGRAIERRRGQLLRASRLGLLLRALVAGILGLRGRRRVRHVGRGLARRAARLRARVLLCGGRRAQALSRGLLRRLERPCNGRMRRAAFNIYGAFPDRFGTIDGLLESQRTCASRLSHRSSKVSTPSQSLYISMVFWNRTRSRLSYRSSSVEDARLHHSFEKRTELSLERRRRAVPCRHVLPRSLDRGGPAPQCSVVFMKKKSG